MSNRIIYTLIFLWLSYAAFASWHFFHPSYTWSPKEVARERIYP